MNELHLAQMSSTPLDMKVGIYLYGDELEPSFISKVLGVSSAIYQKKGEFTASSKNKANSVIAKIGMWALIAEIDSVNVGDHIDELLCKVGNPPVPLNLIEGVSEAHLDVAFFGSDDEEPRKTAEARLSRVHVETIGRLGLGMQFTVY